MTPRDLRQRRLALGSSIGDVAKRVGVPASLVAQWEDGSAPISTPSALQQVLAELESTAKVRTRFASVDKLPGGDSYVGSKSR